MKLKINRVGLPGISSTTAWLTHGDKTLEWDVSIVDKTSYNGEFDIFEQLNGYWENQPSQKQDKIFSIYARIKEVMSTIWEPDDLCQALYVPVAELLDEHSMKDVLHYVDFYSNIKIPDGVKDTYKESELSAGTRERTYIKEDYRSLIALTLALRTMVPVWGDFICRTGDSAGTAYKEYYASHLLSRSSIINTPAWTKLKVFVELSLPADKSRSAAILGGISSEDFPAWILGLVVVRRLTVGDLRGIDASASLVTFIYKYVGQRVKGHDANFIGMVKEKTIEGQGQESENNLSKLEGYKIKQEITAGDIATMRHALRDIRAVVLSIVPDIDPALITASINSTAVLANQQIWKQQVILAQWVLRSAVRPRGLMQLEKKSVIDAIAASQAILWHRGHKELAALISAIAQKNRTTINITESTSGAHRHRITKELVEELNALYPYSRRSGKQSSRTGKQQTNAAITSIELLEKMLSENDWRLTLPTSWVKELVGKNDLYYVVPPDIRIKLANLAVAVAKRAI